MKATSAIPKVSPIAARAEGSLSTRVERLPSGVTLEMRAFKPPVHGPGGVGTCVHCPAVETGPPAANRRHYQPHCARTDRPTGGSLAIQPGSEFAFGTRGGKSSQRWSPKTGWAIQLVDRSD